MITILFIHASHCKECDAAEKNINKAIQMSHDQVEIKKMHFESKGVVNIAIRNGINTLPAAIINGVVFQGDNFDTSEIYTAIKKTVS